MIDSLHDAIVKNKYLEVRRIINISSSFINTKDNKGKTPLMYAVERKHITIAKLLIEYGAYLYTRDNRGYSMLDYAIKNKDKEFLEFLEKNQIMANQGNFNFMICFTLTEKEKIKKIKSLIKKGIDIKSEEDWILHFASCFNYVKTVKLLIEYGVDVNAKRKNGWTALHYASCFDNLDIFKLFLKAGVDVSIKDKFGKTALDIAIEYYCKNVIEYLRKNNFMIKMCGI